MASMASGGDCVFKVDFHLVVFLDKRHTFSETISISYLGTYTYI